MANNSQSKHIVINIYFNDLSIKKTPNNKNIAKKIKDQLYAKFNKKINNKTIFFF